MLIKQICFGNKSKEKLSDWNGRDTFPSEHEAAQKHNIVSQKVIYNRRPWLTFTQNFVSDMMSFFACNRYNIRPRL